MLRIHRTKLSQSKFSRMSWLGLAGTVSCCALVLVFGLMLFPSLPQETYAAPEVPVNPPSVGTSVGINLPASIDFDSVTPTPDGATTTATAGLTVTTTNSASYSLYLYSSDGDNSLRPKISANTSSIIATAGGVGLTLSSLKPNTWGYNLGTEAPTDATTYSAVPTDNSTPVQTKDTSDTNSANDTYTLSFGAKVDTTTASGAYSNTLTIAVVAEPKRISSLTELTYMQEMTPEICVNSQENDTARLIDSRDGKYYWVAKLKDGNCWMTQNLDLDLSASTPLTPDDSDVSTNWTPYHSTEPQGSITGSDSRTGTYSWDPGMYVLSNQDAYTYGDCGGVNSLADSACTAIGWTDVTNMVPMSDSITNMAISGNTYNAHYLIGNYYQWNTATAGTGGSITNAEATDSICPKGWKLPISNRTTVGSYYYLLEQYGLYSSYNSTAIVQTPLYFTPSGSVFFSSSTSSTGEILVPGYRGNYWSSSTRNASSNPRIFADAFQFESSGINVDFYFSGRSNGYSVRCLAR